MSEETRSPEPDDQPDERIGELLRRHASLYHDPPATPREAMWGRIEAARGKAEEGGGGVIPLAPRWWLGALAIAAVLALGVALGRISLREETERGGAAAPAVAEAPASREPESGTARPVEAPEVEEVAPAELAGVEQAAEAPAARSDRAAARPVVDAGGEAPSPEGPPPGRATGSQLYRLASQQMLGQAEALLLQYRSDRAADRMDPAVGRWARDVLSSTRLLLDSPAADDPGMSALLRDLELVLAQIVQRTGSADPLDDAMIDRTLEDRDLMPRIRGAIPTGVGAI